MATNLVFSYDEKHVEIWTLAATKGSGVPVVGGASGAQPGITLTGTGDYTKSSTVGPYTVSGIPAGGVGLEGKEASVAVDGTWELAVTGATTSTAQNALVYFVASDGTLTTTAGSNKVFGKVNYPKDYVKAAGILPVKIGVFA